MNFFCKLLSFIVFEERKTLRQDTYISNMDYYISQRKVIYDYHTPMDEFCQDI